MNRSTSKIGYSQSFANCLDTCPKCGQNVCEHTSVADVIHLPNSISQDFSTYSSNSSLIKQLFNDSSAALAQHFSNSNRHINFSRLSINTLNNFKNSKFSSTNNGSNFYINSQKKSPKNLKNQTNTDNKDSSNKNINDKKNQLPCFTTRPISCQVLSIDNETTDKLLREFFNETSPKLPTSTTTDKSDETLKRETMPPKPDEWISSSNTDHSGHIIEDLQKMTKMASDKVKNQKKKKTKFSNFRLFLKSGSKDKSSKSMRSRGLVNCLTSSASSSASSCEELRQYQKMALKSKKQQSSEATDGNYANTSSTDADETKKPEQNLEDFKIKLNKKNNDELKRIDHTKSVFSIGSRVSNYLCEMDDYNELRNLNNMCPLVNSDAEEDLLTVPVGVCEDSLVHDSINNEKKNSYGRSGSKKGKRSTNSCSGGKRCGGNQFCSNNNINSNNFNNNSIVTNHNNTTNVNNISSIISVPLNNYLFYNYERKESSGSDKKSEEADCKDKKTERPESTTSNETITTAPEKQAFTTNNNKNTNKNPSLVTSHQLNHHQSPLRSLNLKRLAPIEKMSNIISSADYVESNLLLTNTPNNNTINNTKKSNYDYPKPSSSFFTSCSTLDHSLTLTTTTTSNKTPSTTTTTTTISNTLPKYHSLPIIFLLIALFTINFFQELFMLFYYYSTEQTNWFLSSLVAIISGQFLTLIIALLADIDLINLTPPVPIKSSLLLTSVSTSFESTTESTKQKLLTAPKACQQQKHDQKDVHLIFQSPMSKICLLLIPGFLPISVYLKFFTHLFAYRNTPNRFKSEFQLSLHQFFNAVFYSLPLCLVNACYMASTTTAKSLNWYYSELFSFFSAAALYFRTTDQDEILSENNNPQQQQLILFLVSIFVSISIGLCLFTTYYHLMKQINLNTALTYNDLASNNKLLNLGLVEVLVYFCYKFCLIVSRVATLSLFWYLFREWLGLALFLHIAFLYTTTLLTVNLNDLTTPENFTKPTQQPPQQCSGLKQHLVLFITCLLGCVDLFMNQLSEIFYLKKVVGYYVIYFLQNLVVLTFWLVKTVLESRKALLIEQDELEQDETGNRNKLILYSGKMDKLLGNFAEYLTPITCYAGLIYLCVVLFSVFGLVLKFLHLHILRKRYRRVYN